MARISGLVCITCISKQDEMTQTDPWLIAFVHVWMHAET
ncbi:hypothetical protein SynBIOSE41_03664 [Synechococcus sp. BIOS-E4-1]|nr:hypothetical protein SynBIOSE41_03664 [Synechococcus sp. BIOS-E4-1]